MSSWVHNAEAVFTWLGGLGVTGLIGQQAFERINARRKAADERDKRKADAADVLTETALTLVGPLKQELEDLHKQLRKVTADSERKVEELNKRLSEATTLADSALHELRRLKAAILDPSATLGGLRDLVTRSSRNGMP